MYVCGISDQQYKEERFDVWEDVQGLDFSYFKRLSYIEPLIDTVDRNQIATNTTDLFSFDINTVTEADLAFTSEFTLVAERTDCVDALSVHFDTPFTAGHEAVVLSTTPLTAPTHWRQTVLYLHNPLRMKKGEHAKFRMRCCPNTGNPRDLDIALHVEFDGELQSSHYDQDFRLR
ncbi:putative arginine N-methyltransferase [Trypanosoma grayi]|uniref:putative arginine N-methyltransferase n=1 Tax=Trypanosoma grayi TaxID=71804 RepID=UPI0004F403EE|nr:putative arginine N-methyltransferase [Trypanosoma grayi]KEG06719.1 putative arginine N-methyltransferase [Trypanosoma grayi]